jgi:prepilin-type N-terminal cleavage/methylation domain-containing protein
MRYRAGVRSRSFDSQISQSAPPAELPLAVYLDLPKVSVRPSGCLRQATRPAPAGTCSGLRFPVSGFRSRLAFTLLEVLVATAVLALMMTFLFNLLGSSAKLWETGNKKIEAAQAARVGLNIMATDLKNAFAGNMTTYSSNGSTLQNYANYFATDSPPNTIGVGNAITSNGSHQIRFISSTSDPSDPLNEIGYQCVYMTGNNSIGMTPNRSFLVRKRVTSDSASIFIRTNGPAPTSPAWVPANGGWSYTSNYQTFQPIIENCIGLEFIYAYQNGNSVEWTADPNNNPTPNNYSALPLGVLVKVKVIDSRTAEKIVQISNGDPAASGDANVQRLISQGSVTMSRFIPFNSN